MTSNQKTCRPERIEQFLEQRLSEEEQVAFELHLDHCYECRDQLETTAASEDVWTGVREALPQTTELGQHAELVSTENDGLAFSYDTVLKMLAPTDDDRMIGRLGVYEVVGVIGSGGMGIVLKAFDASLNRYVAIKVLAPHLGNSGAARKRFSREAQAAAAVVHDNVIEIHGVAAASGLSYLVMPYVRGPSLQRRLDQEGQLALAEILRVGMQTAAGLSAAHAQGLVHRDVKPANILLADGVERVKLTDFGLARTTDDISLTKTGIIAGTPQYMSPEQARGESIDQRSDLFSLGSVLYAMCTGRAPFRAETSYGMLRRITDDEPQPIREINPEIPDWLCQIIARLMSKQPADRFESAHEVAELLEECLAHVQQPTAVPLPAALVRRSNRFFSPLGVITMLAAFGLGLFAMFLVSAVPPDISGRWSGAEWGQIVLETEKPGKYVGTYSGAYSEEGGKLNLEWSHIERRFNGSWSEGKDRFGKLSLRLVDDKIRGGWTTSKESKVNPGTPELADLQWIRFKKTATVKSKASKLFAWQQSEPYIPPNFETFFPDDAKGGLALDDLWKSQDRDSRTDQEILDTVRRGLRRTRQHRTLILRWIGNKYIWSKSSQNPQAIEIMYHAADYSGEQADPYGTRHYAVYFGLSVTQPKTPAILRTLAELCIRVDDPNDLGRVAWGAKNQRTELMAYLKPFLSSGDPKVRSKAQVCQKIFTGELKAFAWAAEQAKSRAQQNFADQLPQVKETLASGSSEERHKTLRLVSKERLSLIMDNSFIQAFEACARDKDPRIREQVAIIVGGRWVWEAQQQSPQAIKLMLLLSKDDNREVRYNAVYYGLSTIHNKSDDVVSRLLEMAFTDREQNLFGRIEWGLRNERARVADKLNEYMNDPNKQHSKAAREIFQQMTGRPPSEGNDSQSVIKKSPGTADTSSATSEFPYLIKFEQGATRFKKGDDITILEIRGTAKTFMPGNTYWIKGTYALASHERASLDAYITAKNAGEGIRVPTKQVQKMKVDRGKGAFTLVLPMGYEGWPHVSFYPHGGGEGFGGNYFGTGESVLKQWWGEKPTEQKAVDTVRQ